ncbi:hypothetical protein L249_8083 [Ophiocordyceps polyrhachis-furcata BCC 54312]|uniref:GPI inositol-deacylase n=1 Tax=Ophiocordyceps polyrhachis-furcata BCC 54312 TaxID=1330021 RepID=A0A367LH84_9HYPO|nr:hypothetical protein L249_8083 [Ophiocordyceps polyrhachis-furcata BCC 54312]
MTGCSSASTEDGDDFQPRAINHQPESKPRPPPTLISHVQNGHASAVLAQSPPIAPSTSTMSLGRISPVPKSSRSRQGSWTASPLVFCVASLGLALLFVILRSLLRHGVEPKGCRMSYMSPSYLHFSDFDTEHTRFATKYSLYLYREQGLDDDDKLHGIPVLFIPGNAGSYKQVRPIAAEAANYFYNSLRHDGFSTEAGVRNLDFFTVDFNEDITAFHGQTLLDQAEYLNEAVRYILSLYSDPQRADRDGQVPDPTAVVILGHSMGGVVARAMLIQPNYQPKSINSIITMSAPHARPPVTFDAQIVHIYDEINDYWRNAYAQKWANDNPLWHVTLVSIAGGSLDTVVPSDYASLESLVPDTHGFTVFTSGIPTVWTSMDHQAILWCDQFRKVVTRALYDIVDVGRASQTKPRADRMRLLKRRLLPGMESASEKMVAFRDDSTLLTLGDDSARFVPTGTRLVLDSATDSSAPMAYLIPVLPPGTPGDKRFTLITDASLDENSADGHVEAFICSVFPHDLDSVGSSFSTHIDLSGGSSTPTRLACKNSALDRILLPPHSLNSRGHARPYTYLQYGPEHLADHQFIAVVVKAPSSFLLAEFSDSRDFQKHYDTSLARLLTLGLSFQLPADRPVVVDVGLRSVASALLAFDLQMSQGVCSGEQKLALLMRQYLDKPYESKYFVNASQVSVSLHGTAPFVPPPLEAAKQSGLALQFWSDPACDSPLTVRLKLDVWGSLGKLYMRYRTILAAFPLLVEAMVLRKQFGVYDETGIFLSYCESLDLSLRRSVPLLLLCLTLLPSSVGLSSVLGLLWRRQGSTQLPSFHRNELLLGTEDFLFCLLIPLIGMVSVGVCMMLHCVMVCFTRALGLLLGLFNGASHFELRQPPPPPPPPPSSSSSSSSSPSTSGRRIVFSALLLLLVSTFIPYQFAYVVACLVQVFTVARAYRSSTLVASACNDNFYHYAHSILLLMMWVLPINLPILAVWVRNLAVHWLTPFSSHHNIFSIIPFLLLVENLTTGSMVPRMTSWLRHVTNLVLFGTAACVAVYGVSHAYALHYLVNAVAAWLVCLHSTASASTLLGPCTVLGGNGRKGVNDKSP